MSEAEYVGVTELCKEILYVKQILNFMGIDPTLHIPLKIDNIGTIQMARNNKSGTGTRHVNYHYHFCRELQGSLIDLVFVKSEDNETDILTKNIGRKEHCKHAPKLVSNITDHIRYRCLVEIKYDSKELDG